MVMDLEVAIGVLADAQNYWDVFAIEDADNIRRTYRTWARILHPDKNPGSTEAAHAFTQLNYYHSQAQAALAAGKYGQPLVLATIRTKIATHVVKDRLGAGDICTLFRTETALETGKDVGFLKVAKQVRDNDLLANEATALKILHEDDHVLQRHIPKLLDKFVYREGTRRRANVTEWYPGLTLDQLRASFPQGLSPLHASWIWRRLLMALGFAHDRGMLHGAVIPEHVLIHPETRAVMLLDWCYSRQANGAHKGQPILATAGGSQRAMWYPEEVRAKETPTVATDLYMAAQTLSWLMATPDGRSTAPRPLRAYFKGCILTKQNMRPQNAWVLLDEFDVLLERIGEPFHPRRYQELVVPSGAS